MRKVICKEATAGGRFDSFLDSDFGLRSPLVEVSVNIAFTSFAVADIREAKGVVVPPIISDFPNMIHD